MVLVTVDRSLRTASVCDEHKILFRQRDLRVPVLRAALNSAGRLLTVFDLKTDICDLRAELKFYSRCLQIFLHRKDQGFVLVIAGEFQGREIRKSTDVMDESLEIPFHLQCTVPVFKGEHGSPVEPELRTKYLIVKDILDTLVVEVLIPCKEKLHDLHAAFLAQTELPVRVGVLTAMFCRTAEGIVWIMLV